MVVKVVHTNYSSRLTATSKKQITAPHKHPQRVRIFRQKIHICIV